eukprot:SAG31_NODE_25_length_33055_cov_11.407919_1_plen_86_part_00
MYSPLMFAKSFDSDSFCRAVAWYQAYQKGKLTHDELWEMLQFDQSSWRAELHDAEKRVLEQQELRELAATIHFGTSSESSMSGSL